MKRIVLIIIIIFIIGLSYYAWERKYNTDDANVEAPFNVSQLSEYKAEGFPPVATKVYKTEWFQLEIPEEWEAKEGVTEGKTLISFTLGKGGTPIPQSTIQIRPALSDERSLNLLQRKLQSDSSIELKSIMVGGSEGLYFTSPDTSGVILLKDGMVFQLGLWLIRPQIIESFTFLQ